MKKSIFLATGVILVTALVFISCSKDETGKGVITDTFVAEESSGDSTDTAAGDSGSGNEASEQGQDVYVYVCGEVTNPGVYEINEGSRVFEAVELAGGMTPEAKFGGVNLAGTVSDGDMIVIPGPEEAGTDDGLVNINSASSEELQTLPGIGEGRAAAIIEYRENVGEFTSPEDIMNVSGIKEASFNRLKDLIKVR